MTTISINLSGLNQLKKDIEKASKQWVKVGVLAGATYPNGTPVSDVATYLEYGWTQKVTKKQLGYLWAHGAHIGRNAVLNMPPRPIFRGTAEAKRAKWIKLGTNSLKGINESNALNKITKTLLLLGMVAQEDIQDTIQNGGTGSVSFALRSPMTIAMYGHAINAEGHKLDDTPNQSTTLKPLYRSGLLSSSIVFNIENSGISSQEQESQDSKALKAFTSSNEYKTAEGIY